VVKSYHDSDQARGYFEAEVDAFRKLNSTGERIPNLIGCYGAFRQNGSYHIILEYANVGTLEDYFRKTQPPEERSEVLKLWTNLFGLNDALVKIHDGGGSNSSTPHRGEIFKG
jgi:serine/threonine protein kinase